MDASCKRGGSMKQQKRSPFNVAAHMDASMGNTLPTYKDANARNSMPSKSVQILGCSGQRRRNAPIVQASVAATKESV
jgi:hypothetical protein